MSEIMTDTIGELALALATAQGQFKPIEKKSVNPFFKSKYADLAAINDGVREALTKNGLAVTQIIMPDDTKAKVETYLIHKSGQWLRSTIALKPVKDDPQGFGSAITYARRYGLSAILGIASEEEDDGNEASKPQPKKVAPPAEARTEPPGVASNPEWNSHIDETWLRESMKALEIKGIKGYSEKNLTLHCDNITNPALKSKSLAEAVSRLTHLEADNLVKSIKTALAS